MTSTISLAASPEAYSIFRSLEEATAMAKFKGAVLQCEQCGADFRVSPNRAATAKSCSHKCAVIARAKTNQRRALVACKECGISFEVPQSHVDRRTYCSRACMEGSPAIHDMKAGRIGDKNPAWKGGRILRADGYICVIAPDHPFSWGGYIMEHRLLMEQWLRENDPASSFLVTINGELYLSSEYEVHHKDLTRSNNDIENLQCLTPSEHAKLHNKIARDALEYYRIHVINAQ